MKRDYYDVLGIDKSAQPNEIKAAYRKKAVQYHPDKNKGDKAAEEKFKEAAEAYSVLSDAQKRARYDRFGHAGVGSQSGGGFDPDIFSDFSDILGDFFGFGDMFGGRRRTRAERGADLRYDLRITFEEAAFGVKTKIKIPRHAACGKCRGTGADPVHGTATCPSCGGRGQTTYQQGFFTISRTCGHCRGTGQVVKQRCPECQGAGVRAEEKVIELKIPGGVQAGSRLRVAGEGEAGSFGGPSGDLYVVIDVEPHPFFHRDEQNNNVLCEVPISFAQAALGGEVTVKTLEGDERIRIPEATQTGAIFRLRGKGVHSLNGHGRGDLLVKTVVVTPTRLNEAQREALQRLAEVSGEEHAEGTFFEKVRDFFSWT